MKVCLVCRARFDASGWRCPVCDAEPPGVGTIQFAPELAHTGESFEPESFERLAGLEEGSFWFVSRNRLIAWALRKYAPAARSFLEVGAGTGFVLGGLRAGFPGLRLAGGELLQAGLDVARRRLPDVELFQMDARRIPFEAEFDAVGAFDVLEHVDEDELVLAQLGQAVRPGGAVFITVPQHAWLWSAQDEYTHHRRRYSRGDLVRKARRAGLRVERVTSFVTVLLPALAVSRLLQRRIETFDPAAEFRATHHLQAPLQAIMGAEEALIGLGLSLPVGGSLLAVARRPA